MAFSLNVSIDYLLDYENNNVALNVSELSLIAKIRRMNESKKQIIIDLVNLIDKRKGS